MNWQTYVIQHNMLKARIHWMKCGVSFYLVPQPVRDKPNMDSPFHTGWISKILLLSMSDLFSNSVGLDLSRCSGAPAPVQNPLFCTRIAGDQYIWFTEICISSNLLFLDPFDPFCHLPLIWQHAINNKRPNTRQLWCNQHEISWVIQLLLPIAEQADKNHHCTTLFQSSKVS